jgi:hypothetical protein
LILFTILRGIWLVVILEKHLGLVIGALNHPHSKDFLHLQWNMPCQESAAFHTAQSVGNDGEDQHMIFTESCSSQDGIASEKPSYSAS